MTALLPTRISIYDFMIADTQPIDSIIADIGHVSLPQARILIEQSIQAIVSAILSYNQHKGSEAFIKNLLNRNQVKELRKYNAFNTDTMMTAFKCGKPASDVLFHKSQTQKEICHHLAVESDLPIEKVHPILAAMLLICLREIAILVDYSQLDANEVNSWLNLQPQFLRLSSKNPNNDISIDNQSSPRFKTPQFNTMWFEITGYEPPLETKNVATESMPHYAKVIGRSPESFKSSISASNDNRVIVDKSNKSDILTFSKIEGISLPYQRWLLQLAKISDIYLSRNRLKIAPEPKQAPSKPFVNFEFIEQNLSKLTENSDSHNTPDAPFYKNPVLILVLVVIGILTAIAMGKAQFKKKSLAESQTENQTVVMILNPADNLSNEITVDQWPFA